jgi:uncharacterized RmlC-like cupin family protein
MTAGDFMFVPPFLPHLEANMRTTEELMWARLSYAGQHRGESAGSRRRVAAGLSAATSAPM